MHPSTGRGAATEPIVVKPSAGTAVTRDDAFDGTTVTLTNAKLQPVVRYCSRMVRGKVFKLRVVLAEEGKRGSAGITVNGSTGGPLITVVPIIPGAHVTPTEMQISAVPGS